MSIVVFSWRRSDFGDVRRSKETVNPSSERPAPHL
jgi:hypothetical protein